MLRFYVTPRLDFSVEWRHDLQPTGEQGVRLYDRRIPLWTRGDHANFDLQEVGDKLQVIYSRFGQLRTISHTVGRRIPPRQALVLWRDVLIFLSKCRHFVQGPTLVFVADANLDFPLRIKNIEFGDDKRIDAIDHFGVAQHLQIQPTTTPRTSGDGAEF